LLERVNRIVAIIECLVIVAPMIMFAFGSWVFLGIASTPIASEIQRVLFVVLTLAAPGFCLCCGALICKMAYSGSATQLNQPKVLWVGTTMGAAMVCLGAVVHYSYGTVIEHVLEPIDRGFAVFTFGVPMLIPSVHVFVARQLAANHEVRN
jgi:hypothetical protein